MDIEGPPPEQLVTPDPTREPRHQLDVPALVQETIERHPDMSADEVVALLADRGIQVPGELVATLMLKRQDNKQDPSS